MDGKALTWNGRLARSLIMTMSMLLLACPAVADSGFIKIEASDGNIYQISAPARPGVAVEPGKFRILDEGGEPAPVNAELAGELWAAHDAIAEISTSEFSDQKLHSPADIEFAVDVRNESRMKEGVAQIGGIIHNALIVGAVGGGVGFIAVGLVDGISTILSNQQKFTNNQKVIYTASSLSETARYLTDLSDKEGRSVMAVARSGKIIGMEDIRQILNIRHLGAQYDIAASDLVRPLQDRDYAADDYLENVTPGGSTATAIYSAFRDGFVDAGELKQKLNSAVANRSKEIIKQYFSKEAYALNVDYLDREGFFAAQAELVRQDIEKKKRIAQEERERVAKELAKKKALEKKRAAELAEKTRKLKEKMERLAKKREAMRSDLAAMVEDTKTVIENASELDQNASLEDIKKAKDKLYDEVWRWESYRKMMAEGVERLKWAIEELSDGHVDEVSFNGQKFVKQDLEAYKEDLDERSIILAYAESVVGNSSKRDESLPIYAVYSRLKSWSKDRRLMAEKAKELADREKELARIAKQQEELRELDAERQRELLRLYKELHLKEEGMGEFFDGTPSGRYGNWIPERWDETGLPKSGDRVCVTVMGHDCGIPGIEIPGIDQNELNRRQREIIRRGVADSGASATLYSPPLLMGQFRELPMSVNSERVDPQPLIWALFGDAYSIADWNDVKAAYNSNPQEFTAEYTTGVGSEKTPSTPYDPEIPGNTHIRPGAGMFVLRNGSDSIGRINYGGVNFDRRYFMNYHAGQTPGYYAVHDQVGGNQFVLGSWETNMPWLAKKNVSSTPDYEFDPTAGPATQQVWKGMAINWLPNDIIVQDDFQIELNPALHRIESVGDGIVNETIYRQGSWATNERASFYYGKNYMGVAWGDVSKFDDPNEDFGWAVTIPSRDLGNYDYTSWGEWQKNQSYDPATGALTNTKAGAHWIAGQLTPGNNIPDNSSASYNGRVVGLVAESGVTRSVRGAAVLTANFGNRTLTGQFRDMTANGAPWKTLNVNAGWNGGVNSINGTLSGDGATGTVHGNFFGPRAEEMGGTWQTTAGAEQAAGIYRAKKQ